MNRRKKKIRSARLSKIIFIIVLVLIALIVYFIFRMGLFSIKEIEVKGDDLICADANQLKNSEFFYGLNFFLVDKQKLIDNFKKKFICIKNINLSRSFPSKIKMEVISRKPAAVLITFSNQQSSSSALIENSIASSSAEEIVDSFLLDDEGVVFSKATSELNVPKIYTYNSKIVVGQKLEDIVNNALIILNKVKTLGIEIRKSWIVDDLYILQTENPESKNTLRIIFQMKKKIDIQLASLQLILAEAKINRRTIPTEVGRNLRTVSPEAGIDSGNVEFIDLRFDKPIIRLAPKK